jgi:hypothetical protein
MKHIPYAFLGLLVGVSIAKVVHMPQVYTDRSTEERIEAQYEHELSCQASMDLLSLAIIEETESCTTDTECEDLAVKYNIPEDCL